MQSDLTCISMEKLKKSKILRDIKLLELSKITKTFITQRRMFFESIEWKVEDAGNQHFLLFLHSFLPFKKDIMSLFIIVVC